MSREGKTVKLALLFFASIVDALYLFTELSQWPQLLDGEMEADSDYIPCWLWVNARAEILTQDCLLQHLSFQCLWPNMSRIQVPKAQGTVKQNLVIAGVSSQRLRSVCRHSSCWPCQEGCLTPQTNRKELRWQPTETGIRGPRGSSNPSEGRTKWPSRD